MRRSTTIVGAIAVAGIVAAAGSAFTATSTIDHATKTVGATGQTISGVDVTGVTYTWDSATDDTSGVDFTIGAALGVNDNLAVALDGQAGACTVTGTAVACTWATPVHNATSLSIVVN
jgi:hypothetical protein